MPVKILLQTPRDRAPQWQRALRAALPDATIAVWPEPMPEPDYVLVWKPPAEIFAHTRPKRAIFNLGAGVEVLLSVSGLPEAVPVIRLENAGMASQMAEYVTLAVLSAFREAREYAAQQRERRWQPRPPLVKDEFGVGILGLGLLGQAVARVLGTFSFPLSGWSATRKQISGIRAFAGTGELTDFLASARVLVCLLPSTPETRGLLDRAKLEHLPRGAHLINVARGNIVVEGDLLALLDEGHLAGATLDVFHEEPLPSGHPFWQHPKITLTPHTSAITVVEDSITQIAAKIGRLERGEAVTGIVDRVRGY